MNLGNLATGLFMGITWGAVIFLTIYCFYKVFKSEK